MKGSRSRSESRVVTDLNCAHEARQVTTHPSIHHHPFFFVPAYDRAAEKLIFVSHRTGTPQVFFEERVSGQLVLVFVWSDLAEWSFYPSPDGRFV